MPILRERNRGLNRPNAYPIVNRANIEHRVNQLERELTNRPMSQMSKDWTEMIIGIARHQSIPWNTLLLISMVSELQLQQLKDVCSEKTEMTVTYSAEQMVPDNVVHLDFSSGPFNQGDIFLNDETFRMFFDALGHITSLNLSLDNPDKMEEFAPALLIAWTEFNEAKSLLSLDINYPQNGTLNNNKNIFWISVGALTSVRHLRVHNMPNFPPINKMSQLAHLTSLTVIDYRGDLIGLLNQLGANIRVLDIKYNSDNGRCGQPGMERFLANNPAFCSNLVEFRMHGNGLMGPERAEDLLFVTPRKWLQISTCHFPKLRTLLLDGLGDMPINLLLKKLSLLRELRNTTIDSDIQLLTPEMASNFDPFVNMKILIFRTQAPDEYSFEQFAGTIPRLFPNLQALVFRAEDLMFRINLEDYGMELFPRMRSDKLVVLRD